MTDLFTIENLFTLLMLVLLQAVLGFDNLLYISLESKKAPEDRRSYVRKVGIGLAIVLRIVLLFILTSLIGIFQEPIFGLNLGEITAVTNGHNETHMIHGILDSSFNIHSLIVLLGGGFIIYTAIKEIWHMISHEHLDTDKANDKNKKSAAQVIAMIVVMNLVFSFDSILSAMALTNHIGNATTELILMSLAIVFSGILMIVLADKVATFLQRNRMYEVLGLFVLLIVGVMLLSEGGHLAHIEILGNPVEPMSKTTFYFVIVVLIIVDIIQGKYQKKIIKREQAEEEANSSANNE
ncbi:MAG: putative tellurium resistance membrane protein TerC [Crocinitomix sp.]|jgi:predicted tellurium resistance membrane protein TerC